MLKLALTMNNCDFKQREVWFMRQVVFYGAISLDGFLYDENDDLQWLFDTNLNGQSTYETFEKQISTFVMGRKTFEVAQKLMSEATLYAGKEKVVFSRGKHLSQTDTTYPDNSSLGKIPTGVQDTVLLVVHYFLRHFVFSVSAPLYSLTEHILQRSVL